MTSAVWLILWVGLAAAEPCMLEAEGDFAAEAGEGWLVVEVWLAPGHAGLARDLLATLGERDVAAAVVARPEDLAGELAELFAEAVRGGHEPVLAWDGEGDLEQATRVLRRLGRRPRAIAARLPDKLTEATLGSAGYRVLLEEDAHAGARPRLAARFERTTPWTVVLPPGPYRDACGATPHVGRLTAATADRAAAALRGSRDGVVRLALDTALLEPSAADVLARWLDEVLAPAGTTIAPPSTVRKAAIRAMRSADTPPLGGTVTGGRLVAVSQVQEAAGSLREVRSVPRMLGGGLNPTEAWMAFLLVLAERTEGEAVRLPALSGPISYAEPVLDGPVEVPRGELLAAVRALVASPPSHVPSAVRVGEHLLSAGEMLLLMASAVRGETPPRTRPVGVPEPNEPGLGWGRSVP